MNTPSPDSSTPSAFGVRRRVWSLLEAPSPADRAAQWVQKLVLGLIFLNVTAVVAGSVQVVHDAWASWLNAFEVVSVAIFTLEYVLRLWAAPADPRYARPLVGRLRLALTPMALVDLASFLPCYLVFLSVDLRAIRALRLLRLARLAKLGRYFESSRLILGTLRSKREEMILSMSVLLIFVVIGATLMYEVEHEAQPERFADIPSAMWWAVITLTTIGYGDVYPVTGMGKLLGAVLAVLGVLTIALPTGIFAAGFIDELSKSKRARVRACPHCGREIDDEAKSG